MSLVAKARMSASPEVLTWIRGIIAESETVRPPNDPRRGTMSEASCVLLYELAYRMMPTVTVEIGTFIGTSAKVLSEASLHVYTCDDRHDLLHGWADITTYPYTKSTVMLADLVAKHVTADLFFFDGRIQDDDIPLILQLAAKRAVFAFDDFIGHEKGVVNVNKLQPHLKGYVLVPPPERVLSLDSKTTIALLVPEVMA